MECEDALTTLCRDASRQLIQRFYPFELPFFDQIWQWASEQIPKLRQAGPESWQLAQIAGSAAGGLALEPSPDVLDMYRDLTALMAVVGSFADLAEARVTERVRAVVDEVAGPQGVARRVQDGMVDFILQLASRYVGDVEFLVLVGGQHELTYEPDRFHDESNKKRLLWCREDRKELLIARQRCSWEPVTVRLLACLVWYRGNCVRVRSIQSLLWPDGDVPGLPGKAVRQRISELAKRTGGVLRTYVTPAYSNVNPGYTLEASFTDYCLILINNRYPFLKKR